MRKSDHEKEERNTQWIEWEKNEEKEWATEE
jgi:hypothetical protein